MSRIPFLILSFLDFTFFAVTALIFYQNQRKCSISLTNVPGYPASVVQAGHHRAQQIDRQSAIQTSLGESFRNLH